MAKRQSFSRTVPAFVGIDGRGHFAWGTMRPTREACAEMIERWSSPVAGFPPPLQIMPVTIGLDLHHQLAMPLDGPEKAQERL